MTNSMPAFHVLKNKVEIAMISAVSYDQALVRALNKFGRCEVIAAGNVAIDKAANGKAMANGNTSRAARNDGCFTHQRRPYATPGFDERRAALIAAHKAGAL